MSALVVLLVGLFLCFAGTVSIRLAVFVAGFGVAWTLAEAMGAGTGTVLLIALAGAVVAYVLTLVLTRLLFWVGGLCLGAVIGAKIFALVHGGGADVLLAVVLVPAVALVCAMLAHRFRRPFLMAVTAIGGAGLVLTGIGRLWSTADELWRPESQGGVVLTLALWVVLAVAGFVVQRQRVVRREAPGRAAA